MKCCYCAISVVVVLCQDFGAQLHCSYRYITPPFNWELLIPRQYLYKTKLQVV